MIISTIVDKKYSGDYKTIAKVKGAGTYTSYEDTNITPNKEYTYTVRQTNPVPQKSVYDKAGLKIINNVNITVDFQNMKSIIKWTKAEGANEYRVYRERENGDRKRIATSTGSSYTDEYSKDVSALSNILHLKSYIDPSIRDFSYNVRAVKSTKVDGTEKISKGLFLSDGNFKLEPPIIISANSSVLKWGSSPMAKSYKILKRNSVNDNWSLVKTVTHTKGLVTHSTTIPDFDSNKYYAVQAVSQINGKTVTSKIESAFTKKNASFSNKSILFIGDSITYGTPYKKVKDRHIFSYPNRIAQLTGATIYNPSIPGATYHYQNYVSSKERFRLVRDVVEKIYNGKTPANSVALDTAKNSKGQTNTKLKDYDVVFLAAGTNDYTDHTKLGKVDSTDDTTFRGSINKIMGYIEKASKARITEGKSKIKVVFVDLFYSERFGYQGNDLKDRLNRDTTKNKLGYTLKTYQNAINDQYSKWASNKNLKLYKYKTRDANIVNTNNILYMTPDRLHFTRYSYALYGNSMAEFILNNGIFN